jgi:hypothetical protein
MMAASQRVVPGKQGFNVTSESFDCMLRIPRCSTLYGAAAPARNTGGAFVNQALLAAPPPPSHALGRLHPPCARLREGVVPSLLAAIASDNGAHSVTKSSNPSPRALLVEPEPRTAIAQFAALIRKRGCLEGIASTLPSRAAFFSCV